MIHSTSEDFISGIGIQCCLLPQFKKNKSIFLAQKYCHAKKIIYSTNDLQQVLEKDNLLYRHLARIQFAAKGKAR